MATTVITDYEELFNQTLTDILVSGPVSSALLRVFSGGRAVSATASNGRIILDKGGKCEIVTLLNGGGLAISSGSASDVKICSGGSLEIDGNGNDSNAKAIAYNATVSSGGIMHLYKAGTASNTEVMSGGKLILGSYYIGYGTLGTNHTYDTTLYGGSMEVRYSAYAKSNIVSAGTIEVLSGGYAKDNTIKPDGIMNVSKGGKAASNHISGIMNVGGTATSNTVDSEGTLNVLFGGKALGGTVNTGGSMYVNSGGSASGFTLSGLGIMVVSSGGEATGTVMSGGLQSIEGKSYNGTYMNGYTVVQPGGSSVEETILSGAVFIVSGDDTGKGKVSGATIGSGASVSILGGRFAGKTVSNAYIELSDGYAELTDLNGAVADISGGKFHASGGNMSSATVSDYGYGYSKGWMYVSSGATVEKVSVNANAELEIEAGGSVTSANTYGTGEKGGHIWIESEGQLGNALVSGRLRIYSGGMAGTATVYGGGKAVIEGTINKIILHSGASAEVIGGYMDNDGVVSSAMVSSGAVMICRWNAVFGLSEVKNGGKITGFYNGNKFTWSAGAIADFDISDLAPYTYTCVSNLGNALSGGAVFTLTVNSTQTNGKYELADGAAGFDKTITVQNTAGTKLGTLSLGEIVDIGGVNYKLELGTDNVLSVSIGAAALPDFAKSDIDGNGISDVLFQYTGGEGQLGYWMNGTNTWQSTNTTHPTDAWKVLGAYDMNANEKADSVLVGDVEVAGVKGMFIGYYADANDLADGSTWVNISYLGTDGTVTWQNKVGNLTGNTGMNSIVWHSPSAGALGVWTDGTDNWVSLGGGYTSSGGWDLVGCGDFDGDGKDSVVMSGDYSQFFYAVDLDSTSTILGSNYWSGWEVCAIGDFTDDRKDDIVLFHKRSGAIVMGVNGDLDNYKDIGQLDKSDWFVVGAGDYNGDSRDDLLVRQKSTGMLGYYSSGNMSQWNVLGYGVDMNWTVIA